VVAADGRIAKVPSTADDPGRAVRAGVRELLGDDGADVMAHGTTVATNAVLEGRLARTALITNEGFADVIEIGRQDRPSLYDAHVDRPVALVPRELRLEVAGRVGSVGEEIEPLGAVPAVPDDVEVVAVCLLHSDLSPAHEVDVAAELAGRGIDVTTSSSVSPEFREVERMVTTVLDAGLRPVCRRYLRSLATAAPEVLVMTSAGGLVPAADAAERPAALLLSGPAGGVLAAAGIAAANGFPDALTFDMGGTSTDVCLVLDGRPEPAAQRTVAGYPVRMPALDVHTIGAGGGSIARLDAGGALVVGPESAGALPGPACYGRGGTDPTVTDADLVAGRIPAGAAFPGLGVLDVGAAEQALGAAGVTADGVIAVVNASMEQALRTVSVARGVDPRELALVAFGGAGPLHACELAEAIGTTTVIVPPRAGVFSAVGILTAPRQVDLVRSWAHPTDHDPLGDALAELADRALQAIGGGALEGRVELTTAVDCRYEGQSHELTVESPGDFPVEHARRNGYAREGAVVEVVAIRATCRVHPPLSLHDLPAPPRGTATGPAVVAEDDCTIWVPAGWETTPGALGALVLRRTP
jgi:N-methylhydantoinase A/oxoprolinase/acetone carboxylase beta subunit